MGEDKTFSTNLGSLITNTLYHKRTPDSTHMNTFVFKLTYITNNQLINYLV
jgi:hypothetical protein